MLVFTTNRKNRNFGIRYLQQAVKFIAVGRPSTMMWYLQKMSYKFFFVTMSQ